MGFVDGFLKGRTNQPCQFNIREISLKGINTGHTPLLKLTNTLSVNLPVKQVPV